MAKLVWVNLATASWTLATTFGAEALHDSVTRFSRESFARRFGAVIQETIS